MIQAGSIRRFALTLALTLCVGGSQAAMAQQALPVADQRPHIAAIEQTVIDQVASGLKAYDETPLGDRTPLVLVHGIGGTDSRYFHWENFLAFAKKKQDFNARYKIYLYHYDSTESVPDISGDLQRMLKGFIGSLEGRDIKILAYSEGGLLVRNALQDEYLNENTIEVLTIATPFHGSPLANPEWMARQAENESPFNLVRMTQKLAYRIAGAKYPTFKQDFRWDNFDGAIPHEQYVKLNGARTPVDYALARKVNFTTYGSYFGLAIDPEIMPNKMDLEHAPPPEKPMPGNLFRKNFLFSLVRNNIGKLPLAKKPQSPEPIEEVVLSMPGRLTNQPLPPEGRVLEEVTLAMAGDEPIQLMATAVATRHLPETKSVQDLPADGSTDQPVSMMMYNDGISPISSTLWLGRFTPEFSEINQPVQRLWVTLKSLKGNRNTRLFAGLDHRNWMDGETRTGEEKIRDLLNPDQPPRSVFEWILFDLMS